ncbi:hypothetical protein [Variovorax paradoxus]|uniref:hypothetical protein n=1 Tax=Variovorax paradoxus TaxID=34073 RepID=UPI002856B164|nr:hypothetical protein [Variovorax paradoxus]MDR6455481.1 hypothetical protein [Variovorax paradoxus]
MALNLSYDLIDVSEITDRVDELREAREDWALDAAQDLDTEGARNLWATEFPEDAEELANLESILEDLCGYGGDHQWEGDWYPQTLIARSHFVTYAQDLAEDCGMVNPHASWPNNCIDWEFAASQLEQDYSEVTVNGSEYLYR